MPTLVRRFIQRNMHMLVPRMPVPGKNYTLSQIRHDLVAGITVAGVLIPQSIGYALLAGVPPINGLYAALFGGIAGSLWGDSKYLATGPIAVVSLLTFTAVAPLAVPGSIPYIAIIAALTLIVGFIQVAVGFSRLGFLLRLVPQSVLVGFASSAALIIVITQIPHVLGLHVSQSAYAFQMIIDIVRHLTMTEPLSLAVGVVSFVALIGIPHTSRRFPTALFVLGVSIAASYVFHFDALGISTAGTIPVGFPLAHLPHLSLEVITELGGKAFIIALVGFMTSYALAKEIAEREHAKVHVDQEIVGQGFANIFSGLLSGIPVGGSLSRTMIKYEAKAATAWADILASAVVAIVIFFFSGVIAYLPDATLSALVILAVLKIVDFAHIRRMYRIWPSDGIIAGVTLVAGFLFLPEEAILIGVVLALLLFLHRVIWADVVVLGIDPELNILRAKREDKERLETPKGTLLVRIDTSFFYANSERLIESMRSLLKSSEHESDVHVEHLVIDCAGIDFIDSAGVEDLERFAEEIRGHHTQLSLIYVHETVRTALKRSEILSRVRIIHNILQLKALTSGATYFVNQTH